MNILYITKLNKSLLNGVTVAVLQLIDAISNYENVFWLDIGDNNFEVNENIKKVSIHNFSYFNYDIAVIEDPFNSIRFCKIADHLYKKNIPYIISPHGCFHKSALRRKWLKKKIAIKTVFKKYLNRCYGTQFLTPNEMENSIIFNESIIIPNGMKITNEYSISKKINNIVFIGRKDVEHKGLDLLINAVKLVKLELEKNNSKIYLYGPTNSKKDDNYIKNEILKNDLKNIIINKGPIVGDEKKDVLCWADAYIQTSRHEGFPMAILEAFSYGLPVIVTYGTNVGDIVQENNVGWVSDNKESDIANMLKKAISCDNVSLYSKNSRNLAQKYDWKNIANLTIQKYNIIIKRSV